MKGVMLEIAPEAQIIDISHAVQPFDILDGALTVSQAYSYFPSGTGPHGDRGSRRGHDATAGDSNE